MPTAARVLLATIIIGAILIWGGVGYLWLGQQGQPNLLSLAQPLSNLPLISSLVPTSTPFPSVPPPLPTFSEALVAFSDSKYNLSFRHPPEMQVVNYSARDAVVGWALQDNRSNLLMEISLTGSTLTDINQRYPNLSFAAFSQANLEGVTASFWSDKEETLFYFLPSDSNNLPYSIWIIARLDEFDPALNLTHSQKQITIEQIIKTIALET